VLRLCNSNFSCFLLTMYSAQLSHSNSILIYSNTMSINRFFRKFSLITFFGSKFEARRKQKCIQAEHCAVYSPALLSLVWERKFRLFGLFPGPQTLVFNFGTRRSPSLFATISILFGSRQKQSRFWFDGKRINFVWCANILKN
jgi:hypothetical protein